MRALAFFLLCYFTSSPVYADVAAYAGRHEMVVESKVYRVKHWHEWGGAKVHEMYARVGAHERFLSGENTFSMLEVTDKRTNVRVFQKPVPALTYLWVSSDEKYIVGLSAIKYLNPYQIVVFTTSGKLLHREHISPYLLRFSIDELRRFYYNFPKARPYFAPLVFKRGQLLYMDAAILGGVWEEDRPEGARDDIEAAFDAINSYGRTAPHPYSENFGGSVTNWVTWFDDSDPGIRIERDSTDYLLLSLNDPDGVRFFIEIPKTTRTSASKIEAVAEPVNPYEVGEKLPGHNLLRESFEIEKATIGSINSMPESLFVEMRAVKPSSVNAIWWWDPLVDGKPSMSWLELLKLHANATEVVSRHQWLAEWRGLSRDRLVELHALGEGIAITKADLDFFVLPLWQHAGFAGAPTYSVLARRGKGWIQMFFGADDSRVLVTSVSQPDAKAEHWLDRLDVSFHPRCKLEERNSHYIVVEPSGRWDLRTFAPCI